MSEIIEKELSYVVTGCLFDVHNEIGPGVREECYQKPVELRLAKAGVPFISKPRTRRELTFCGQSADVFEPDFIVADRLALELKALPDGLPFACVRQTYNYLKFWKCELGLLVNFADVNADIQRIVFHETAAVPVEDFEAVRGRMSPEVRAAMLVVREAALTVHQEFGLGYSANTYRRLMEIALRHRGCECQANLVAEPSFDERRLPSSPISPLQINKSVLVQIEAIQDGVTARAVRTMQTHLGLMAASAGMIASFGQHQFELRGVRPRDRE